jgi:hypothetical protein
VFSRYLDETSGWRNGSLGGVVIKGPLALVGLASRNRWPYEVYELAPVPGASSNIVTGLALLLDDVGVGGMVGVMFVLGLLMGTLFVRYRARPSIVKGCALASSYLLLAWTPVVWLSYYVFWTIQLVATGVIANRFFIAYRADDPARSRRGLHFSERGVVIAAEPPANLGTPSSGSSEGAFSLE